MTSTLPAVVVDEHTGAEPVERDVEADLMRIIGERITAHPRSAQVEIGPSELGVECTGKLARKLAGVPRVGVEVPAWRPTVGTAVHAWLADALAADNAALGWDRWLIETRVFVGIVNGVEVFGSCDVFDRLTATVVDWKVPGVTTIRAARSRRSPGEQYRRQTHAYGLGFERFGLPGTDDALHDVMLRGGVASSWPVRHVAVMFLPAAGELGDGYYWTEPYSRAVALETLDRADRLGQAVTADPDLIPLLPTADDHCAHCAWWSPGAPTSTSSCRGHAGGLTSTTSRPSRSTHTADAPFGRV